MKLCLANTSPVCIEEGKVLNETNRVEEHGLVWSSSVYNIVTQSFTIGMTSLETRETQTCLGYQILTMFIQKYKNYICVKFYSNSQKNIKTKIKTKNQQDYKLMSIKIYQPKSF